MREITGISRALLMSGLLLGFADVASGALVKVTTDRTFDKQVYDQLDCVGPVTLTPTFVDQMDGREGCRFAGSLVVTNGVVTLDLSECGDKDFYLRGHLIVGGEGELRVKGKRKFYHGTKTDLTTFASWDVEPDNLKFVDDDGTDITGSLGEGEGVIFWGQTTYWKNPSSLPHVFEPGAEICPGAVSLADLGVCVPNADNEIVLSDYDLYIIQTNRISDTATIRVRPGRKFTFKPCDRSGLYNWQGAVQSLANDIVLESDKTARAKLIHRASKGCYFHGAVTGDGDFEYMTDNYGTPGGGFKGVVDFTGEVFIRRNAANSTVPSVLHFFIATNCPGNVANPLRLEGPVAVLFSKPNAQNAQREVTIASVEGTTTVVQGVSYAGAVQTYGGQHVTIGTVSGNVKLTGFGAYTLQSVAADAVITVEPAVKVTLGAVAEGAKIVYARTQPNEEFNMMVGDKPCVVQPPQGVLVMTNVLKNGVLDLAALAGATVRGGDGFDCTLDTGATNWTQALTFWMDPAQTACVEALDYKSTNANPHVELLHDARPGATWLLQNNYQRTAEGGQGSKWHASQAPYPQLMLTGYSVNGEARPYLDCGAYSSSSARRLYFGQEGTTPYAAVNIPSEFVVMAFSGQRGGGSALVKDATSGSRNGFGRCEGTPTLASPIFTNAAYTTWIDGVSVDPTQNNVLKAGWQIISFRTNGRNLVGLGYNTINYQDGGGQVYGDVMVFSRELTERERVDVERHLAAKWGVEYQGTAPAAPVARLDGTGTVRVDGEDAVQVAGLFRGTLEVGASASVTIAAAAFPPTAETVQDIANRVNWFDPEATNRLYMCETDGRELEIGGVYDRVDGADENAYMLYSSGVGGVNSRAPWLNVTARGVGAPTRNWIDFSNHYASRGDKLGNVLRYRPAPYTHSGNGDTAQNMTRDIRTGFVVYDSCRGTGSPVLDTIDGKNGDIAIRGTAASPIWTDGTKAYITGGKQYLDGLEVDGTVVPFGGKPEVFSFTTTDDLPLMCMGYYPNSQTDDTAVGEIIGESLFFSTVLSDEARQTVEGYLMAKWLGSSGGTYSDLRQATVTGAGTVVGVAAALPKFAASFTGTVKVEGTALAFTVDGNAVTDALDFGAGTATFAAATVPVSVTCVTKPSSLAFPFKLISWTEGKAPTAAFTLAVDQPMGEKGAFAYKLRTEADGLYLDGVAAGTLMIVR